VFLLILDSFI